MQRSKRAMEEQVGKAKETESKAEIAKRQLESEREAKLRLEQQMAELQRRQREQAIEEERARREEQERAEQALKGQFKDELNRMRRALEDKMAAEEAARFVASRINS